jgi:hypothetical protein
VRLSFVLSTPTRVTFLVFGPGRGCTIVGWFTVAAHRGLNRILFRGRVQRHQLDPGLYRLVPKAQSEAVDSLPTVGIIVDRRGVRPSKPAAWRDCDHAAPGILSELAPSPPGTGVAGVAVLKPPSLKPSSLPSLHTKAQPNPTSHAGAFVLGVDGNLVRYAFLLGLLSLSLVLISVARLPTSELIARYQATRAIARHRDEIALLGVGLLCGAALLFFL